MEESRRWGKQNESRRRRRRSVATETNGRPFVQVISDGVLSLEKEKLCGIPQAFGGLFLVVFLLPFFVLFLLFYSSSFHELLFCAFLFRL